MTSSTGDDLEAYLSKVLDARSLLELTGLAC